jgi:hypothetical protein
MVYLFMVFVNRSFSLTIIKSFITKIDNQNKSSGLLCQNYLQLLEYKSPEFSASRFFSNLDLYTQYLLTEMENGCQVDAVYTDFSKAFDKVSIQK